MKPQPPPIELPEMASPSPDEPTEPSLLDLVLTPPAHEKIDGVLVGRVIGVGDTTRVIFHGCPEDGGVEARATIDLSDADLGAEVALLFERGDPMRPIVMGRMARSQVTTLALPPSTDDESSPEQPQTLQVEVEKDGERVVISAERELVLRCGESSITLTRAGKILIKGAYLLTRSTGVNRIQGGSVQIN